MDRIEQLIQTASEVETAPQAATKAMVELAQIYGEGRDGVDFDLHEALQWAEKAAHQDSPDGYLEITKIAGSACIAASNLRSKREYSGYVIGTCDQDTVLRFQRPEIAYNVGTVCEYMADFVSQNGFDDEGLHFASLASVYYEMTLGLSVFATDGISLKSAQEAEKGINRMAEEWGHNRELDHDAMGRPAAPKHPSSVRKYVFH